MSFKMSTEVRMPGRTDQIKEKACIVSLVWDKLAAFDKFTCLLGEGCLIQKTDRTSRIGIQDI